MKSLRVKLLVPFVGLIIAIPLAGILAFNVFIRLYTDRTVIDQLVFSSESSRLIFKQQIAAILYEDDSEVVQKTLDNLYRSLISTKAALNVELMIFDDKLDLIYPKSLEKSFLPSGIVENINTKLKELSIDEPLIFDDNNLRVAVTGYKLSELPVSGIPYVVFASSLNIADDFIESVNRLLIIVLFVGGLFGFLITFRIADGVAKPLRKLVDATFDIKKFKTFRPSGKTNILEIKNLTDSIEEISYSLNAYDRMQKMFLQNASHELKTPLMSIQGYAEGIEKGVFPDNGVAARIIIEESVKLNALLTELLTLSRLDNVDYKATLERHNVCNFVTEYYQVLQGVALKAGKSLNISFLSDTAYVNCSEILVGQILMNIGGNAIRYASTRVDITLKVNKTAGVVEIFIEDDGNGINPDELPFIFDRFFKGSKGQHGLGLAIAKTSAETMNGSVIAANTGHGALFIIRLPLCE